MNVLTKNPRTLSCLCLAALFSVSGCKDLYDLPADKDFISDGLTFTTKVFEPINGRTTVFNPLNSNNSTLPLKFEIVNLRYGDGRPEDDVLKQVQVYEWITEYDGKEKTLAEIEAKRRLVTKPIFEVDSGGRFIYWNSSSDALVTPRAADTVLSAQQIRYFDLKITNSGGTRYEKDFQLIPWLERGYSPSNDINPYTGGIAPDPISPKDPRKRDYITPSELNNVVGEQSNVALVNNNEKNDVVVYIRKFEGGNGHNLRFRFIDKAGNDINPLLFNETRWDEILHGFNRVTTANYVQYDVAYPVPINAIRSPYTSGNNARVLFAYSRRGFGGLRTTGRIALNFQIFRAGDWEIVFHFRNDNPKFEDE